MMELLPEKIGQAEIMTIADGPDTFPGECGHWYNPAAVKKIVESARKDEREACAIVCESEAVGHRDGFGNHCAAIIRRGVEFESDKVKLGHALRS